MHDLGYKYTGEGNLYQITWIELMRMVDASHIIADLAAGIRQGDLNKLDTLHAKLQAKANNNAVN